MSAAHLACLRLCERLVGSSTPGPHQHCAGAQWHRRALGSQPTTIRALLLWMSSDGGVIPSMATKYIVGSVTASFAFAYVCGVYLADKKVLGGTTPRTVANKEWWKATDEKFNAWPCTAGKPVAMNPITRQNYIVKKKLRTPKASG